MAQVKAASGIGQDEIQDLQYVATERVIREFDEQVEHFNVALEACRCGSLSFAELMLEVSLVGTRLALVLRDQQFQQQQRDCGEHLEQ